MHSCILKTNDPMTSGVPLGQAHEASCLRVREDSRDSATGNEGTEVCWSTLWAFHPRRASPDDFPPSTNPLNSALQNYLPLHRNNVIEESGVQLQCTGVELENGVFQKVNSKPMYMILIICIIENIKEMGKHQGDYPAHSFSTSCF